MPRVWKVYSGAFLATKDERGAVRRQLRLEVEGTSSSGNAARVRIHNLSEKGFLIEASTALEVGDPIELELSDSVKRTATVVWSKDRFAGCRFVDRATTAEVSAALLRSPARHPDPPSENLESPLVESHEVCRRCGTPIKAAEVPQRVNFLDSEGGWLQQLSGPYHSDCLESMFDLFRIHDLLDRPGG